MKNQNRNVNDSLALAEDKFPHNSTRKTDDGDLSGGVLKEIQEMKKRMKKLEKENEQLKQANEEKFKVFAERFSEVNDALSKRKRIDGTLKSLLNSDRT